MTKKQEENKEEFDLYQEFLNYYQQVKGYLYEEDKETLKKGEKDENFRD